MKKQTDTLKLLRAVMKDVNGDNHQIIKTIQDLIYLMEFIDICSAVEVSEISMVVYVT